MQKLKKIIAAALCLCLLFAFAGCKQNSQDSQTGDKLKIVCTLFPQYDFARRIAGENAQITLLLTPGTDSHSYDPSPVDMVKINECNMFIYTGDLMESWAADVVAGLDKGVSVLNLSECVSLKNTAGEHPDHAETGHDHSVDPHIWTSPVNAVLIVQEICERLCEVDAENAEYYRNNSSAYIYELEALDKELREITQRAATKKIIMCDRFAMLYFCEEYGLDYIAAFDACTSNTEPSPAVIVEITNEVKKASIPAVFCAELSNRKVAEAVAEQTGATVLELHSCHNLSAADFNAGETYISLMQRNAENIKFALGVN